MRPTPTQPRPTPGSRSPASPPAPVTVRHPADQRLTLRDDPATRTRDLTGRLMQVRAATADDATRSVEVTMSTDAPVTVWDWERGMIDEVLVAGGGEFPDQLPLLSNHSRYSLDDVLGSVRGIRREGGAWAGRAYFADGDDDAQRAWNKVRQGHLTDVSIGYRSAEFTDIPRGQKQVVGGREYAAGPERDLRVTTRWQAKELSVVPIGADSNSKVREQPGGATPARTPAEAGKERRMNPQLRKYLESLGLRSDATDAQAQAFYRALGKPARTRADAVGTGTLTLDQARAEGDDEGAPADEGGDETPAEDGDEDEVREEGEDEAPEGERRQRGRGTTRRSRPGQRPDQVRAERDRQSRIRRLAGTDVPTALAARALDEGWTVGRASRAFLEHVRGARAGVVGAEAPAGIVRSHERDCTRHSLGLALVMRGGGGDDRTLQNAARRMGVRETWENLAQRADRYRDMSLLDVCREALRMDGRDLPATRDETIRSAVSGGTLTSVFTTSINAALMAAWEEAEDTTAGWVQEVDVADFKTMDEIDVTRNARLERIARGGTARDADLADTKESWRIARYAKKAAISEEDIIDDNLGVLAETPRAFGDAARRLRPDLVYSLLLANPTLGADGAALFNATALSTAGGHANLGTGGGSALSSASLKAAITAMGKQVMGSGKNVRNLNVKPRYLIVPQDLRFTAAELISSAQILKSTGSDTTVEFGRNTIVDEQLELRSDNRIGTAGVLDPTTDAVRAGSATNWFLAAAPMGRTIKVGYLRGTGRAPMIRPYVLDKGQWGVGWDIKMDLGAVVQDYRGFYKSAGA